MADDHPCHCLGSAPTTTTKTNATAAAAAAATPTTHATGHGRTRLDDNFFAAAALPPATAAAAAAAQHPDGRSAGHRLGHGHLPGAAGGLRNEPSHGSAMHFGVAADASGTPVEDLTLRFTEVSTTSPPPSPPPAPPSSPVAPAEGGDGDKSGTKPAA